MAFLNHSGEGTGVDAASTGLDVTWGIAKAIFGKPILAEWQRNSSDLIRRAEKISGLSREDIAELLEANPDLVPLTTRILFAAGTRHSDEVLKALSAVLAYALVNPEGVDDAQVYVDVLEKLGTHHIRLLKRAEHLMLELPRFGASDLYRDSGMSDAMGRMSLNDLVQADLLTEARTHVQAMSVSNTPMYELTDSGRLVLEVLERVKDQ